MKFADYLFITKDKITSMEHFKIIKGYIDIESIATEIENEFDDNDMTTLYVEPYITFTSFSKEPDITVAGYMVVRRLHHDENNRISYHVNEFKFNLSKQIAQIGKIIKVFEDQKDSIDKKVAIEYIKSLSPYMLSFTHN